MKMNMPFGEKVRCLREEQNISQTELGKALNITQRKVSYIERGTYEPSLEDIIAICSFFNVSADYLLGIPKGKSYPER